MAVCCTCGHVLQRFWVIWDDRQPGWRVTPNSPNTSRADTVYAASLTEAAYAIHHDPTALVHDAVCPPGNQPGWRAYGPPGHDLIPRLTALMAAVADSSLQDPRLPAA